jgi:hypothetical protein
VHGNCEREIVAAFDGRDVPGLNGESARAAASLIERRHRDLLDGLPLTVTLDVDGLGPVLFCHATPRRDDECVLVDSPLPVWSRALAGVAEHVVVMGHTHMPFDRLVDGRRAVNPGSVGMSYGVPGACWSLLGPDITLRSTAYDVELAAARIRSGGHPDASGWAEEYVLAHYGDAEALAAFTPLVDPPPDIAS